VDVAFKAAGYKEGASFESKVFEGEAHNEAAWAARLTAPLRFLYGGGEQG
jgi:hypothetical protein